MAFRGKPSTAHEYNTHGTCKYCGLLKSNILAMSLVCTPEREEQTDTGVQTPPAMAPHHSLKDELKEDFQKLRGKHG